MWFVSRRADILPCHSCVGCRPVVARQVAADLAAAKEEAKARAKARRARAEDDDGDDEDGDDEEEEEEEGSEVCGDKV